MSLRAFHCALGVLVCVASAGAHAASYVDRPLEQRIARAERVVVARVVSTRVERGGTDRPRLMTVVGLEVEETLKGAPVKSITLRQLGGSAEGWSVELPGAPTFEPNERAVFLLRCEPTEAGKEVAACTLAGLRDAKLPVVMSQGRADVLVPQVASPRMERMTLEAIRTRAKAAEVGR
ncbi:MAG: hypothetical protein WBV82_26280 [Myxococcaceae bacterium]